MKKVFVQRETILYTRKHHSDNCLYILTVISENPTEVTFTGQLDTSVSLSTNHIYIIYDIDDDKITFNQNGVIFIYNKSDHIYITKVENEGYSGIMVSDIPLISETEYVPILDEMDILKQ